MADLYKFHPPVANFFEKLHLMREAQITSLKGIFLICGILLSLLAINLIHDRHVEDIAQNSQTDSLIQPTNSPSTFTILNDFLGRPFDFLLNSPDSENKNTDEYIPKKLVPVKVLFKAESSDDAIKDKTIDFLPLLSDVPLRQGSFVGIINKGNSCYADSVLQMLFRFPLIRKIVSNLQIYYEIIKEKVDELEAQALEIYEEVKVKNQEIKSLEFKREDLIAAVSFVEGLNHMFHQLQVNEKGKPATFKFKKSMQCMPGIYAENEQEDALQYYNSALDKLKDFLPTNQKHHLSMHCSSKGVHKSLPGVVPEISEPKSTTESIFILSLAVDSSMENLNQILRFYSREEEFERNFDNGSPGTCIQETKLVNLPEIIPIHLKRLTWNFKTRNLVKNDSLITIPYILNFGQVSEDSKREAFYVLKMYVTHSGSATGGHYYAHSHESDGKWYKLNDPQVTALGSESPKDLSTSYMYFYERIHPDAPVPCLESLTVPELFLIRYNGFMSKTLIEKYSPKIITPTPPVNTKPRTIKKPILKPTVITPVRKIVKITRENNRPKSEDNENGDKSDGNKDVISTPADPKTIPPKVQAYRERQLQKQELKQQRKQEREKERAQKELLEKIKLQEQARKMKQEQQRKLEMFLKQLQEQKQEQERQQKKGGGNRKNNHKK